ncbi:MAG: hypothetical protein ACREXY_17820 [Gammaproteobacteria bacterium]
MKEVKGLGHIKQFGLFGVMVAGLALLPLLVVRAQGNAPIPSVGQSTVVKEAKLPSVERTIHLTGPVGWAQTSPLFIRLAAVGTPPTQSVRLADASGLNQAMVSFPAGKCSEEPLRYTGLGTDEWCLEVRGLAPGSTSSAMIATAGERAPRTGARRVATSSTEPDPDRGRQ